MGNFSSKMGDKVTEGKCTSVDTDKKVDICPLARADAADDDKDACYEICVTGEVE